jgi:phage FluMu protein Com
MLTGTRLEYKDKVLKISVKTDKSEDWISLEDAENVVPVNCPMCKEVIGIKDLNAPKVLHISVTGEKELSCVPCPRSARPIYCSKCKTMLVIE